VNLSTEDTRLLDELCEQHGVSRDKVLKLLDAVREYEFKDRRTGVYDALREIPVSGSQKGQCGELARHLRGVFCGKNRQRAK
jgi:hypothetical protein